MFFFFFFLIFPFCLVFFFFFFGGGGGVVNAPQYAVRVRYNIGLFDYILREAWYKSIFFGIS